MNVNTNQTDLWLQMLQTAAQIAQSTIPAVGEGSGSKDSGSDFKTMLEDKRTQAAQKPSDAQTGTADRTEKPAQGTQTDSPKAEMPEEAVEADPAQAQAALQAAMAAGMGMIQAPEAQPEGTAPTAPVVENAAPVVQAEIQPQTVEAVPTAVVQPQTAPAAPVQTETFAAQPEAQAVETAPAGSAISDQQTVQPAQQGQEEGWSELPTQTGKSGRDESQFEAVQVQVQAERPVFQEAENLPIKVGDGATLDTTQESLDTGLQQRITQALDQGLQKVEVRLTPENLGTVTIELTQTGNGALHVVLRAESEQTASLLRDHAGTLGMLLQGSGQSQVQVEVPQAQSSEQPWQRPDQDSGQSGQQGRQRQGQNRHAENPENFLQQLRLGLIQAEQA